jgi:hypothetical protein
MGKDKTIQVMDDLMVPEKYREDFIRVLKYGARHCAPAPDPELDSLLKGWIEKEEAKINDFEGRTVDAFSVTEPIDNDNEEDE